LYGNSGPLPSTIIIGSCIPTRGSPHKVPLLLTLRARWGLRVYQFSGNTFARMTHWEIGKRPTSIIKTRVHYTYLIPRRGATPNWNQQFLDCVYTEAIIHTPKERRLGCVWRIGFSGNTNRQRKRQRCGHQ